MLRNRLWIAIVTAVALLAPLAAVAGEEKTEPTTPAVEKAQPVPEAETAPTPEKQAHGGKKAAKLDGAKVFAWNCGSCHSERYPNERTDAKWDSIVTHMRVRANLTAGQAEAVLRYLKENNR